MRRKLKPVSPGEMLAEEFLKPLGMSNYRPAKQIGVAFSLDEVIRPFFDLKSARGGLPSQLGAISGVATKANSQISTLATVLPRKA
jgi:hypothetical protein